MKRIVFSLLALVLILTLTASLFSCAAKTSGTTESGTTETTTEPVGGTTVSSDAALESEPWENVALDGIQRFDAKLDSNGREQINQFIGSVPDGILREKYRSILGVDAVYLPSGIWLSVQYGTSTSTSSFRSSPRERVKLTEEMLESGFVITLPPGEEEKMEEYSSSFRELLCAALYWISPDTGECRMVKVEPESFAGRLMIDNGGLVWLTAHVDTVSLVEYSGRGPTYIYVASIFRHRFSYDGECQESRGTNYYIQVDISAR